MRNEELIRYLAKIEIHLQAIEARLAALVPARDIRAAMSEATEHNAAMAEATPLAAAQLDTIVAWLHDRMTGDQLQFQFDDILFVTKQLASISEGWRSDIVQMRSEIRRLAALIEADRKERSEPLNRVRSG